MHEFLFCGSVPVFYGLPCWLVAESVSAAAQPQLAEWFCWEWWLLRIPSLWTFPRPQGHLFETGGRRGRNNILFRLLWNGHRWFQSYKILSQVGKNKKIRSANLHPRSAQSRQQQRNSTVCLQCLLCFADGFKLQQSLPLGSLPSRLLCQLRCTAARCSRRVIVQH